MGREARLKKQKRLQQAQAQPQAPAPPPVTLATTAALRARVRAEVAVPIDGTDLTIICRPPDLSRLWGSGITREKLERLSNVQSNGGGFHPEVNEVLDAWASAAAVRPRVVLDEEQAVEGQSIWVGDLPLDTRMAIFTLGCAGLGSKPNSLAPFVPTPPEVVTAMLELARVTATDTVYDVGSGDGRIVIAAAALGAKAVGIDYDAARIAEARTAAKAARVTMRATFLHQDATKVDGLDVSTASVVMLYLLATSNLRLRDRLLTQLQPGARVVSHAFDMGDWSATDKKTVSVGDRTYPLYLWEIPAHDPSTGDKRQLRGQHLKAAGIDKQTGTEAPSRT